MKTGETTMLTTSEAGKLLGVSGATISRLIRERRLRAFDYSGSYRVDYEDLMQFKSQSEIKPSRQMEMHNR